jgi:DNA gyrase/topoisomerase IV subunit A
MFNFLKKSDERLDKNQNSANSNEYERLSTRISDISAELKSLKASIDAMQTGLDNLRGNFNRKLKGLSAEEEKPKEKEIETINNTEFVAFG